MCKEPIAALKARGTESSVALFGQTVFTLVPQAKAKEARDALKCFGGTLLVCNVDGNGARVL
jgi:pantoate kinase